MGKSVDRSEEHTSELQSHSHLVCRLLLEKKKCKSEEHTSELQSHSHLVCRLLLEKKNRCARRGRKLAPGSPAGRLRRAGRAARSLAAGSPAGRCRWLGRQSTYSRSFFFLKNPATPEFSPFSLLAPFPT